MSRWFNQGERKGEPKNEAKQSTDGLIRKNPPQG